MTTSYLDNFYARLGIPKNANEEQIRSAYHEAARRLHPDTSDDPRAVELFLHIQEAYETLSNPKKRAAYDAALPTDIDPPADIMVNTMYSRSMLPVLDEPQLIYVLLDLMPVSYGEGESEPKDSPLNISLILDTSTSMAGARMDMVKMAAVELVRQLKPEDIISIVTFNDRATVIVSATRGINFNAVESRISLLQTGGGTEIYKGLEAGFTQVLGHLSASLVNHLILVTDGRTYGDEELCLRLAEDAAKRGVAISTLGIGSEWNDEFVDQLANITGGNSVYAAQTKDIHLFLQQKFSSLSKTYADNVTLELATGPNAELRYAFRLSPDPSGLLGDASIPLGAVPHDGHLSVIMEFVVNSIPPQAESVTLAEGKIRFEIPTRTIPSTSSRFSFARPVRDDPEVEAPPQVLVKSMSRLALYRMQEQARREMEAGNVEKATERLNNLATQLLLTGQADLADTVKLTIKNLESGKVLTRGHEKDLKYKTRSLFLEEDVSEKESDR